MDKYLKEDESLSFLCEEECHGVKVQVYCDDYGQSFIIAFIVPQTGQLITWNCGTFNDYHQDMPDVVDYYVNSVNVIHERRRR